jgi:hypothetical protein
MVLIIVIIVLGVSIMVTMATLVLLAFGIWSQEQAPSLAHEPQGWCARLARRLLGLHVRREPEQTGEDQPPEASPPSTGHWPG